MRASRLGLGLLVLAACGDPEVITPPSGGGGEAGASNGGSGGSGGSGAGFASGGGGSTSNVMPDPCDGVSCDPGLTCEDGSCVLVTCAEANCSATEECVLQANGGAVCVDISCSDDVECPTERYCNGTICVDDECVAGSTSCVGDELFECAQNGSSTSSQFTCGSTAYFDSNCVDDGSGNAHCGCFDDWDCPAFTQCDAGQCAGTGLAPTCQLPPLALTNPAPEIVWGGTSEQQRAALGSPHELSSQVVMTPVVANLDDDNGDGLVNERDFPEIIFQTFCNQEISSNGILRAIHGGGPAKGDDFFSVCGSSTWREGDPLPNDCAVGAANCTAATLNSTAAIAVGDIDGDGLPEIVGISEDRGLQIFRNDGTLALTTVGAIWPSAGYANPAPTIANIDNAGFAEVAVGRFVLTFANDANGNLIHVDTFSGSLMNGTQGQGPVVCIANLVGDTKQEIVAGTTAYGFPSAPAGATQRSDCAMFPPQNAEETAFCNGSLLVAWDGQTVNTAAVLPSTRRDGFCSIADVLGADTVMPTGPANPLDGAPEVVLINEGYLLILNGATGALRQSTSIGAGTDGGAPNIDDFDGDGFPEVGSAFGTRYEVLDLQAPSPSCPAWPDVLSDATSLSGPQTNPARTPPALACTQDADCQAVDAGTVCNEITQSCVCLHNGWKRGTEDDSSRVTGSSVFDFNGDGGAEVIYNDECYFRLYDGLTASVLFKEASESRTRIEYPVVADVDNDGNGEIVFATSNESGFCSEGGNFNYNNGLEVWGDPSDSWVSARRIWSEHAYHVTNVSESAAVPTIEPESWRPWNGRLYNTYRSNPRSLGVAPDLVVSAVQFSSPGAACGMLTDELTITFQVDNQGDLRVGPGIVLGFEGLWNGFGSEPLNADAVPTPLTLTLQNSLEPGESVILTVAYDATFNTPMMLPDEITVIADVGNLANECNELNNELSEPVDSGDMQADLRIEVTSVTNDCPPDVDATVFNDGSLEAANVVVRFYSGDPNQGGTPLQEFTIAGPIPAGGSATLSETLTAFNGSALNATIFAIVDPDNAIEECNDGNNKDAGDQTVSCAPQ
jgi:hypothetical protein